MYEKRREVSMSNFGLFYGNFGLFYGSFRQFYAKKTRAKLRAR